MAERATATLPGVAINAPISYRHSYRQGISAELPSPILLGHRYPCFLSRRSSILHQVYAGEVRHALVVNRAALPQPGHRPPTALLLRVACQSDQPRFRLVALS